MPKQYLPSIGFGSYSSEGVYNLSKAACLALAVSAIPAFGILSAAPASAQSIDHALYTGGKARVSRSANLRSLTEAITSASCRVNNGFGAEIAMGELSASRVDFKKIIDGLVNGSPALGMPGPEERARTLKALRATASIWDPLDIAAERIASGQGTSDDAATIRNGFSDLFEQTVQSASVVAGQYTDPQQLLQSDATVLNFAIRQRALAHRMTREMCELASDISSGNTSEELPKTVNLFEQTLIALRDGFPGMGLNPPPNDAVRFSLESTYELWRTQRGIFDKAIAGNKVSSEDVVKAASLSHALSVAMNNTITLYLIATPGQDGVYRVPLTAYAQDELKRWLTNDKLIAAIKAQNAEHANLSADAIIALDQQWRAEATNGDGPLIRKLLSDPVSNWLLEQQAGTVGFVTEVFVMDNKGLNVAQSVETSDYWQGDEAKWQKTFTVGADALHISEVEFDDSTGYYQSQASLAISDPETGQVIGAITFGINVQNLM